MSKVEGLSRERDGLFFMSGLGRPELAETTAETLFLSAPRLELAETTAETLLLSAPRPELAETTAETPLLSAPRPELAETTAKTPLFSAPRPIAWPRIFPQGTEKSIQKVWNIMRI